MMTTTTELRAIYADIQSLLQQGKAMDAFEKYYAEDVLMQENDNPPTVGKAANRARELDFFAKVTEFRGLKLKEVAYREDLIISEWFADYTHAELGKVTHDQISVSRWKDGKIISDRYYYAT
jgi:SnoaL-like domain